MRRLRSVCFSGMSLAPGAKRVCFGVAAGLLLLICACEPEATPLPNNLPTLPPATTDARNAPTPAPVRYAIAPNLSPFLLPDDSAQISANTSLIALTEPPNPSEFGVSYDFIVGLSDLPDGTAAPSPLQINLIINTTLPPLDNPALAEIVRRALAPAKLVSALAIPGAQPVTATPVDPLILRTELANAGYPDGFDLTISDQIAPGAAAIVQVLATVGIETRVVTDPGEAVHLTLTTVQAADAIPLFSVPISYRAVDGLSISFTASGFPIAQK